MSDRRIEIRPVTDRDYELRIGGEVVARTEISCVSRCDRFIRFGNAHGGGVHVPCETTVNVVLEHLGQFYVSAFAAGQDSAASVTVKQARNIADEQITKALDSLSVEVKR